MNELYVKTKYRNVICKSCFKYYKRNDFYYHRKVDKDCKDAVYAFLNIGEVVELTKVHHKYKRPYLFIDDS